MVLRLRDALSTSFQVPDFESSVRTKDRTAYASGGGNTAINTQRTTFEACAPHSHEPVKVMSRCFYHHAVPSNEYAFTLLAPRAV